MQTENGIETLRDLILLRQPKLLFHLVDSVGELVDAFTQLGNVVFEGGRAGDERPDYFRDPLDAALNRQLLQALILGFGYPDADKSSFISPAAFAAYPLKIAPPASHRNTAYNEFIGTYFQ